MNDVVRRIESIRAKVRAAAVGPDLVAILDGLTIGGGSGQVRVVVAGETNRGKSSLVNTLIGRPLLSPVDADVTTSCWLELSYGDHEEATVLLADPASLGSPRRLPIQVRDIARYVALREITDPVVGVEVRLPAPLLRDIVLVDTPGVGGLRAGHSQTTLTALQQADALLFVCDVTQPILVPEVDFLIAAVRRVPTVVIALTKRDLNPGYEVVLADTVSRLGQRHELRALPVFAVASALADRAVDVEDDAVRAKLMELSGIGPLVDALRDRAAAGGHALRLANAARVIATVAHGMAGATDEGDVQAKIDKIEALLDDRPRLEMEIHHRLARLSGETQDSYTATVSRLAERYRVEAERGPAAQLVTLAPRMIADLTAAGVATLEEAADRMTRVTKGLLDRVGAADMAADLPPRELVLSVAPPQPPPGGWTGVGHAIEVFDRVTRLVGGAATIMSVLTGPGVLATCIAVAAGAGWWRVRGGGEQERRTHLRAWVDAAVTAAETGFGRETRIRTRQVQDYLDSVLPDLLATRQRELTTLRATARVQPQRTLLEGLAKQADELADVLPEGKWTP